MKQLIEFATECLVCHVRDLATLPEWFVAGRRRLNHGDLVAFDVMDDPMVLTRLQTLATDDLPRVMDHFHLWTPLCAPSGRQELVDALFESVGSDLDGIVHVDQNRDNIRNLLGIIQRHYGCIEQLQVLDFGSGSGLSADVASDIGLRLMAYDRCPKMRALSAGRGLRVLEPAEFSGMLTATLDAVFGSYVFHLLPAKDDLHRLWALLRTGGIIVGNFHKDHGRTEVSAFFAQLGAEVRIVEAVPSCFRHGSCCLYVRHS